MSNFALVKAALTALAFLGVYKAVSWTFFVLTSPLRRLRGPPSTSLITGHALLVRDLYPAAINGEWTRDYGKVMRLKTLFGVRLHSASYIYSKFDDWHVEQCSLHHRHASPEPHHNTFHGVYKADSRDQ